VIPVKDEDPEAIGTRIQIPNPCPVATPVPATSTNGRGSLDAIGGPERCPERCPEALEGAKFTLDVVGEGCAAHTLARISVILGRPDPWISARQLRHPRIHHHEAKLALGVVGEGCAAHTPRQSHRPRDHR